MKRTCVILAAVLISTLFIWTAKPLQAQSPGPIETVNTVIDTLNSGDVDGATTLFADDAIATFHPAPPYGEGVRVGVDDIREHVGLFIGEGGNVSLKHCSAQGTSVLCSAEVTERGLAPLGLSHLEFEASFTVHTGLVKAYHWTMTAESQARLANALTLAANLQIAQRFIDEFANGGDMDAADQLISPEFVDHGVSPGNLTMDRDGLKEAMAGVQAAFEAPFVAEDIIASGDKVVIRGKFQGVQSGEFLGMASSGEELTHTWIVILRIEDGQIVERWANLDELKFLIDLGLVSPPGS